MQYVEIKNKTAKELQDLQTQMKKKLFNLRFQRAAGELTNMSEFKKTRKIIARIKTYLNDFAREDGAKKIKESSHV